MIHLNRRSYPYLEEVNEGIVREFRRLLPFTGRVLDVGCGRGQLGEAIRNLGWEVWGVEQSAEACATARGRLNRLVEADLHDLSRVRGEVGDTTFDGLIFSDVLEHVYDPRTVLEQYLALVKPGGRVFVSVPNFVVWTNRLKLAFGRVDYSDTGVMDRTHIRLFTFRTARELVDSAGAKVERTASTPHLVRAFLPLLKRLRGSNGTAPVGPRALIDSKGYRLYMRYCYPPEQFMASLWRSLFAFRIIVVGQKPAEGPGA
jgi:2-polyprenyl-3-methyl-5-hydroxy-6-metoxy-1,4-benzoquinol methylase